MTKHVFEVYWETKTSRGVRRYSRAFPHEITAVPFFAAKKGQPSTARAFVREVELAANDRGRIVDARTVNILCTFNINFSRI